jgi:type I restriction enzyme S subunit
MQAGSAITAETIEETGDYPVYGAHGLRGYCDGYTHEGVHLLIGRQGALCGNVSLATGRFWASEHAIVLTPRAAVNPRWLLYVLQWADLGTLSTSAAQPGISVGVVGRVRVAVPSRSEQDQIVKFLDRETAQIDEMISAQDDLDSLLREREKGVLSGYLDAMWAYPTERLQRFFRTSNEANRPELEVLSVYRDFGVILKSSRDDNFNKTPENLERYLVVREGDVVVNRMKAWQGSLGVSPHEGIVSADYEVLRPVSEDYDPAFLHLLLRSPRLVGEYRSRSTGIRPSQWRLYWDAMRLIQVPLPPLAIQRSVRSKIETDLQEVHVLREATRDSVALMRERRRALVGSVVTGQIEPVSTPKNQERAAS